jgi:hypothetical protein
MGAKLHGAWRWKNLEGGSGVSVFNTVVESVIIALQLSQTTIQLTSQTSFQHHVILVQKAQLFLQLTRIDARIRIKG